MISALRFVILSALALCSAASTFVTTMKLPRAADRETPFCSKEQYPKPFCPEGTKMTGSWNYTEAAGSYNAAYNCVTHASCSESAH